MFQKHLLNIFLTFVLPAILMWFVVLLLFLKEECDE